MLNAQHAEFKDRGNSRRSSLRCACSAIYYMHLSLPFLPLPYLEFQFAEIAIVMAVILYGPLAGTLASFEYLIILEMLGQFAPFGPLLAFLGVVSIVIGMGVARYLLFNANRKTGVWSYASISIIIAASIRVPLLTFANLAYFYLIAPNFINIATSELSSFLGNAVISSFALVLVFTAFFNIIQSVRHSPCYCCVRLHICKMEPLQHRQILAPKLYCNGEKGVSCLS